MLTQTLITRLQADVISLHDRVWWAQEGALPFHMDLADKPYPTVRDGIRETNLIDNRMGLAPIGAVHLFRHGNNDKLAIDFRGGGTKVLTADEFGHYAPGLQFTSVYEMLGRGPIGYIGWCERFGQR